LKFSQRGGGTQSTAISALIAQGQLPKPDFTVIADTGREMPTTWQYLDAIVRPAFAAIGLEIFRISTKDFAAPRGRQIFATSGQLMIPAFSNKSGEPSKLTAFCSGAWKQEVTGRWLSLTQQLTRSKYRKWIGFSLDETRRIAQMQKGKEYLAGLIRFPLVHDIPTRRQGAIRIVENMGWPKPPRSRCWMCPNQSDMEWSEVATDYPHLFSDAIELDESIRERDPHAFLHSTIKPLKDADLSKPDDLFSGSCPSGECFL
jgi:hypothetical protein